MTSPQLEDGHTKIANELLEAIIRCKLPGDEGQIFWTIIRKTYGFNKKMDGITLSQFCLATGLIKPNACRALSNLITKNMIIKSDKGLIPTYRIQKDYTKWLPLSKLITLSDSIKTIIKSDNSGVIKSDKLQKTINNTKDNVTKRPKKFSDTDLELTALLFSLILENDSGSRVIRMTGNQLDSWIDECRKLRDLDKRTPEQIESVIEWCQEDNFEKTVVLSMPKLRKRFDELLLKSKKDIPQPKKYASEAFLEGE